jgi:cysteinyl-tRNA synthetase
MDKGKMSKSAGGFLTLQSLIDEGFDPLDYRYFLLGGHYRSQLQFSFESLKGAKNSRKSLMDKIRNLAAKTGIDYLAVCQGYGIVDLETFNKEQKFTLFGEEIYKYIEEFERAIEDDLNTPRALAELWGLLKDGPAVKEALAAAFDMDIVLGLGLKEALKIDENSKIDEEFTKEIEELIKKRTEAKKIQDFTAADNIRQNLKERGIILEDGPSGTTWKPII